MARHHGDLFRALVSFFHLDPRTGRRTAAPETEEHEEDVSDFDQVTGPDDATDASL
jgi:hypothetical protein